MRSGPACLAAAWLNRVLSVTLTGDQPAELTLSWRTDRTALGRLEDEYFGKRILFTDHAGLHLSVRELLHPLASIEETVLVYPSTGGRP